MGWHRHKFVRTIGLLVALAMPTVAAAQGLSPAVAGLERLAALARSADALPGLAHLVQSDPNLAELARVVRTDGIEGLEQLDGASQLLEANPALRQVLEAMAESPEVVEIIDPANCETGGMAERTLATVFDVGQVTVAPWFAQGVNRAEIDRLKETLDWTKPKTIRDFCITPQRDLAAKAREITTGVRARNAGPAGEALNEMVRLLKKYRPPRKNERTYKGPGFISRRMPNVRGWVQYRINGIILAARSFGKANNKIDGAASTLRHEAEVLDADISHIDDLTAAAQQALRAIDVHVMALQEKIQETNAELARMEGEVGKSVDPLTFRTRTESRNAMERRLTDIRGTQQALEQVLGRIHNIQEGDRAMVDKIQVLLENAIPLWEVEVAEATLSHRSYRTSGVIGQASDLTNRMLVETAQDVRDGQKQVTEEVERSIFDIDAISTANQALIEAIDNRREIITRRRGERLVELERINDEERMLFEAITAPPEQLAGPPVPQMITDESGAGSGIEIVVPHTVVEPERVERGEE